LSSQLNVDTIVDKAGSGGTNVKVANTSTYVSDNGAVTQNLVQGLAKAWSHLNVNSGTPAISDSFGISSISDIGTGNTRNTFTNAMLNDNYSVPSSGDAFNFSSVESYATTSYQHRIANTSGSSNDRDHNVSAVFGDLA